MERFTSILIEHVAGDFPLWLAPLQVKVLPISDEFNEYAEGLTQKLRVLNLRAESATRSEAVGAKIGDAEISKIPYRSIAGGRDRTDQTVAVRRHRKGDIGTLSTSVFLKNLVREVEKTQLPPE